MSDGETGDLFVSVSYPNQYDDVTCQNDGTLIRQMYIPWEETLEGNKYSFNLFGACKETITLSLNQEAPNGGAYRLRGLGMGGNADLIVKVWHTLPANIDEESRKTIARAIRDAKPSRVS